MISELVGEVCPICKRRWASTADFARIKIFEGHDADDLEKIVRWIVRCRLCHARINMPISK